VSGTGLTFIRLIKSLGIEQQPAVCPAVWRAGVVKLNAVAILEGL